VELRGHSGGGLGSKGSSRGLARAPVELTPGTVSKRPVLRSSSSFVGFQHYGRREVPRCSGGATCEGLHCSGRRRRDACHSDKWQQQVERVACAHVPVHVHVRKRAAECCGAAGKASVAHIMCLCVCVFSVCVRERMLCVCVREYASWCIRVYVCIYVCACV